MKPVPGSGDIPRCWHRGKHSHSFAAAVFVRIAQAMNISARYVGEEPTSQVTGIYNQILSETLPSGGIDCRIIPRKESGGKAISASTVRQYMQKGEFEPLKELVPATTFEMITSEEFRPVMERIRKAGEVVHY